ncbi:YhhA family cyclophane-containing RiPP [Inhella gelatinilytica]|uniref:Uncharacterized protein n=1 Tax=Inhella gelatinilytica TaxID=2795030 RepID=A0A931NF85_9BURK|nr:YhhA family cyclophane-containing RiPP [Inhella gelatinilytica]MBH9554000.1 hypothetical protein [Inhella gelatinilytica]
MLSNTTQQPQREDLEQRSEVRDAIARGQHANPAMQRLQTRILKVTDASEVITSYDRMHHRHNRS